MTAVYDNFGIRFQYPETWQLEQHSGPPIEVTLDAPQGGFWSLHAFPSDSDCGELLDGVQKTLREQYETVEIEPATSQFGDSEVVGFQAQFYCLDFLVSAAVWAARTDLFTFVCLYQAESREFDQFDLVFRAIMTSLLNESASRAHVAPGTSHTAGKSG